MAKLTFAEKRTLETLLQMSGGYVLDFSNRTFQNFVQESVDRDIYDEKYAIQGESKANRLRAFLNLEDSLAVGKLLRDLIDYASTFDLAEIDRHLLERSREFPAKLLRGPAVPEANVLVASTNEFSFEILAKEARRAIDGNEPEVGLDRLHTFMVKFTRVLCDRHRLEFKPDESLNSLFGKYVKNLVAIGPEKSEMTMRMLKSSISILDSFNSVRNNQSLAHANQLLSYEESLLIYNQVTSLIRFVNSVETMVAGGQRHEAPE